MIGFVIVENKRLFNSSFCFFNSSIFDLFSEMDKYDFSNSSINLLQSDDRREY